jgi:hypothetical protein
MSDQQPSKLEFYAYERLPSVDSQAAELNELRANLSGEDRIKTFRGQTSDQNRELARNLLKEIQSGGYSSIEVLPELKGLKLSDLVLGWLAAVRPSAIRITRGDFNADWRPWRVSITVDENDIITGISQEVVVAYGCGYDMDQLLREAKTGQPARPMGGVIGNMNGIERVDFQ